VTEVRTPALSSWSQTKILPRLSDS